MKYSKLAFNELHDLLHDAILNNLNWEEEHNRIVLDFEPLRKNQDGTDLDHRNVEFQLNEINSVYAYYHPVKFEINPSDLQDFKGITPEELTNWKYKNNDDTALWINSKNQYIDFLTCHKRTKLFGNEIRDDDKSNYKLFIDLGSHEFSNSRYNYSLLICCNDFTIFSNGMPLSLELWKKQCGAWWGNWEEKEYGEKDEPSEEDTFIPVGSEEIKDISYIPPEKAAFKIAYTDCPDELLKPIEIFLTSIINRKWHDVVESSPNFDLKIEDHIKEIEESFFAYEFGRWKYIRQIDNWWTKEKRAVVTCRGIEHSMADDEDPAENFEIVINYDLRKVDNKWYIWSYSSGWPIYGSAPKDKSNKKWLKDWKIKKKTLLSRFQKIFGS